MRVAELEYIRSHATQVTLAEKYTGLSLE